PAELPDTAGVVIAVGVGSLQFRQALAVIDIAACDRAELRMRMLDRRRQDRRWAALAGRPEGMRPLDDAPAIVAAFFDPQDHVPQVLADLAGPQVALPVEIELPRLPDPIGIDLRPGLLVIDEGIVGGDRVGPILPRMVHVDAND